MKVIVVVWLAKIWQTENNSHNKKTKQKGIISDLILLVHRKKVNSSFTFVVLEIFQYTICQPIERIEGRGWDWEILSVHVLIINLSQEGDLGVWPGAY